MAASAAYTITLASLATSSTLVAGRESTSVSNTTNLYLDYGIAGLITVGTTPTVNTIIEVWAYGSLNDTPTYPDVFDGTDSAETVTSVAIKQASLALLAVLNVDATTRPHQVRDRGILRGAARSPPFCPIHRAQAKLSLGASSVTRRSTRNKSSGFPPPSSNAKPP